MTTIRQASNEWLETVKTSRKRKTFETYQCGRDSFLRTLRRKKIDPDRADVSELSARAVGWFAADLKNLSTPTERVYLTAISRFYHYLSAEDLIDVNLEAVAQLIQQRARRPGLRVPQFFQDEIEQVLRYFDDRKVIVHANDREMLRIYRDRALLFTLAGTGMRIHEALALKRGDVDWERQTALLNVTKGDKQAVVRFTTKAINALKQYLDARAVLDGKTGKPLASLPLFARHDTGVGVKIKPITTTTGRTIVEERVLEVLGEKGVKRITPHSFRHYFVSKVLQRHGNLKLAQALARHENIQVTQRYAHITDAELDRGFYEAMEEDE